MLHLFPSFFSCELLFWTCQLPFFPPPPRTPPRGLTAHDCLFSCSCFVQRPYVKVNQHFILSSLQLLNSGSAVCVSSYKRLELFQDYHCTSLSVISFSSGLNRFSVCWRRAPLTVFAFSSITAFPTVKKVYWIQGRRKIEAAVGLQSVKKFGKCWRLLPSKQYDTWAVTWLTRHEKREREKKKRPIYDSYREEERDSEHRKQWCKLLATKHYCVPTAYPACLPRLKRVRRVVLGAYFAGK